MEISPNIITNSSALLESGSQIALKNKEEHQTLKDNPISTILNNDYLHLTDTPNQIRQVEQKTDGFTKEGRERLVEQIKNYVSSITTAVSFRVDDESGHDVITVYETKTGNVIKQIPDEDMLVVLRRLASYTTNNNNALVIEKV